MCSPEYMAKYAKRLIQAGVRFIGGCCGPTPAHIKLISDAVRPLSPRHTGITGKLAGAAARVTEIKEEEIPVTDRKSTRLNSSHANISYAVFCLKKKTITTIVYTSSTRQLNE